MPNYELKAQILNEMPEVLQAAKDLHSYQYFFETCSFHTLPDERQKQIDDGSDLALQLYQVMPNVLEEAERMVNADNIRRKRLRKRIEGMFDFGNVVFLTLTFTDDILDSTSNVTRRRYVARFLKSVSNNYVGNVDYGAEKGREHYHAVLLTDTDDFSGWTYGFYKAEKVRKEGVDALRVAKYISKLTNHAIKETTKRNALIYSR